MTVLRWRVVVRCEKEDEQFLFSAGTTPIISTNHHVVELTDNTPCQHCTTRLKRWKYMHLFIKMKIHFHEYLCMKILHRQNFTSTGVNVLATYTDGSNQKY